PTQEFCLLIPLSSIRRKSFHVYVASFFSYFADPPDLHSFPTRRSSDLFNPEVLGMLAVRFQPDRTEEGLALLEEKWNALDPYEPDRKSTRLNSSHVKISYAVFCLKKKTNRTVKILVSASQIPSADGPIL